ncbi:hypothetical protein Ahy_A10g049863 [Arachis hypogaea]|uniref:Uncharacterized protein n=1 Tax=Arachis hypogaea TaxID=3818 RepID=A0A445B821_ARAHY|nr:hypothetical protein Ahy_A10g049863 [Arachis hypogaea]
MAEAHGFGQLTITLASRFGSSIIILDHRKSSLRLKLLARVSAGIASNTSIVLSSSSAFSDVLSDYQKLQEHLSDNGHWPRDYGGPLFLMSGLVSPSTMFGSVLNYVILRLLSEGPNDGGGDMEKARNWIQSHGGVLGAHEWSRNNPMPPMIWLLRENT